MESQIAFLGNSPEKILNLVKKYQSIFYRPEVEDWLRSLPYATPDYFVRRKSNS